MIKRISPKEPEEKYKTWIGNVWQIHLDFPIHLLIALCNPKLSLLHRARGDVTKTNEERKVELKVLRIGLTHRWRRVLFQTLSWLWSPPHAFEMNSAAPDPSKSNKI